MPFNAAGQWVPEDQSVAKKLDGLLSSDSPYMTQARHAGERTAASRGLQNSSMAAGASQASAIAAAAPLASQDASQIASQNLAFQQGNISKDLQSKDLKSRDELLSKELQSRAALQDDAQASQAGLLDTELASRSNLLDKELGSRGELLNRELENRKALQAMTDEAAALRQKLQIEGSLSETEANNLAALERQTEQLSSQERQAMLAAETRLQEQRIAAEGSLTSSYLSAIGSLSSNPEIKASDRNAYIAEFQRVTNQGRQYSETIASAPMQWSGGSNAPAPQPVQSVLTGEPDINASLEASGLRFVNGQWQLAAQ